MPLIPQSRRAARCTGSSAMGAAAKKVQYADEKHEETHSERMIRISREVSEGRHERVTDFSTEGLYKLFSGE